MRAIFDDKNMAGSGHLLYGFHVGCHTKGVLDDNGFGFFGYLFGHVIGAYGILPGQYIGIDWASPAPEDWFGHGNASKGLHDNFITRGYAKCTEKYF